MSDLDKRWTSKVTDVRNWFVFAASERGKEDGTEHEHYTDSGDKSGGQKEKLASTIGAIWIPTVSPYWTSSAPRFPKHVPCSWTAIHCCAMQEDKPTQALLARLDAAEIGVYNALVDNKYGNAVRLEQERIDFGWMRQYLADL